jgi:hypothetical protein
MRQKEAESPGYGFAFFATILLVFVLVSIPGLDPLPALACVLPVASLLFFRRRLQMLLLSPVTIAVVVLGATGLFGYIFAPSLAGLEGGGIELTMPNDMRVKTAYVFAASAAFVAIGGLVGLHWAKHHRTHLHSEELPGMTAVLLLGVAMIPMVLVVASLGSSLLTRETYLAGEGGSNLFAVGQQLAVAAVAFIGYIVATRGGVTRLIGAAAAGGYLLLFVGLGSRRMALVPICFAIGYAFAGRRHVWIAVAISALVSVAILPIPLYLRGGQIHGLLPYLEALGDFDYGQVDWAVTLNNLLIAFPIAGFTAFGVQSIPIENLWIGLNPLPGEWVGWYDISASLNLNRWTPYSMVGELANYGALPLAVTWLGIGLALAALETRVSKYAARGYPLFAIAVVGLSALFILQSLQYTVRSSTRMLVYAFVVVIAAEVVLYVRGSRSAEPSAGRRSGVVGMSIT